MGADVAPAALDNAARARAREPRPIWQYALAAWLGQRVCLAALVVLWQAMSGSLTLAAFTTAWSQYDGAWYASIAQEGYHTIGQAAFFPLFPLLMRLVAPLIGGNETLAGIIVANVAGLGAFVALGQLVEDEFGLRAAQRTLLYYAILPTGYFLASAYTESLFLLLSVAAFLSMRRRRWLLAGLLIALATLTRAPGALLTLPLAIEAWRALRPEWRAAWTQRRIREALALGGALAAPFVALFGFQLYLSQVYGVSDVMSRALRQPLWRRALDWPWVGLQYELEPFAQAMRGAPLRVAAGTIVIDTLFLALWLGLCALMLAPRLPRLPRSWVMYSWALLIQTLVLPVHLSNKGLMSLPRYMIVVFPCFVLLALLSMRYPRAHLWLFGVFVALTMALTHQMAGGGWVA